MEKHYVIQKLVVTVYDLHGHLHGKTTIIDFYYETS